MYSLMAFTFGGGLTKEIFLDAANVGELERSIYVSALIQPTFHL